MMMRICIHYSKNDGVALKLSNRIGHAKKYTYNSYFTYIYPFGWQPHKGQVTVGMRKHASIAE